MISGSKLPKILGIVGVLAGTGVATALPSPAQARGFVSIGIGVPLVPGPAYYYPPPVVAYPPPAAAYAAPPAAAQGECREYTSTTTIAGQPQNMVGTACRQPDGTWRIIN